MRTLAFLCVAVLTFPSSLSAEDRPKTEAVEVIDLWHAYNSNDAAGDKKFKGKWLELTNCVMLVVRTSGEGYALIVAPSDTKPRSELQIIIELEASETDKAAKVRTGDSVTVSGHHVSKRYLTKGRIESHTPRK